MSCHLRRNRLKLKHHKISNFKLFHFRYTRLGEGAMAMCSLQRAQFVSNCDCIMGRRAVRRFSEKILRDFPVVTIQLEHENHQHE